MRDPGWLVTACGRALGCQLSAVFSLLQPWAIFRQQIVELPAVAQTV